MSNEEKHQIWCYFGVEKFIIGNNEKLSALLTKLLRHHHKRFEYRWPRCFAANAARRPKPSG